jgi:hypothetical protein
MKEPGHHHTPSSSKTMPKSKHSFLNSFLKKKPKKGNNDEFSERLGETPNEAGDSMQMKRPQELGEIPQRLIKDPFLVQKTNPPVSTEERSAEVGPGVNVSNNINRQESGVQKPQGVQNVSALQSNKSRGRNDSNSKSHGRPKSVQKRHRSSDKHRIKTNERKEDIASSRSVVGLGSGSQKPQSSHYISESKQPRPARQTQEIDERTSTKLRKRPSLKVNGNHCRSLYDRKRISASESPRKKLNKKLLVLVSELRSRCDKYRTEIHEIKGKCNTPPTPTKFCISQG